MSLASAPSVLVGHESKDGDLVIIDIETGATTFDANGQSFGKVRKYFYSQPAGQVLLLSEAEGDDFSMAGVRLVDGEVMWRFSSPITDDPVWLGELDDGSILIYGKDEGQRILVALDPNTGQIAWQSRGLVSEDVETDWEVSFRARDKDWRPRSFRIQSPIADSVSSVIIFITKDGPMRLTRRGELVWRAVELAGEDPSQMIHSEGTLYVLQKDEVFALDSTDGKILWHEKYRSAPATSSSTPKDSWCGRRKSSCFWRARQAFRGGSIRCGSRKRDFLPPT